MDLVIHHKFDDQYILQWIRIKVCNFIVTKLLKTTGGKIHMLHFPHLHHTCSMCQKEEEQKLLPAISLWGQRKSHPEDKNRVPPYSQLGLDNLPANGAVIRII